MTAHCTPTADVPVPGLCDRPRDTSTLSETQYTYAFFLAGEGQTAQARESAQRVLRNKVTRPVYLRRRKRAWFRKAKLLLTRLATTAATARPR